MLGLIGGTGLYALDGLEVVEKCDVITPFGKPSAQLVKGRYKDNEVVFLPRHGNNHEYLPHEVNYRANIYALKSQGVNQIVSISAVGSLQDEIRPGDLSVPSQYFDFIKGHREKTFFGNGMVAHVSTAKPVCPRLTKLIVSAGNKDRINIHENKTYACVDGPRLGTQAESLFLRRYAGCDVVGMTNVPEVFLATEAQLCYCTLTISTDYDCWLDDPSQHVSLELVLKNYNKSMSKVKSIIETLLDGTIEGFDCGCRHSLDYAILTDEQTLKNEQKELLAVLKK